MAKTRTWVVVQYQREIAWRIYNSLHSTMAAKRQAYLTRFQTV